MASAYYQRYLNKIRSLLSVLLTNYDPFGEKILEHFQSNRYFPFTCIQPFTFEYKYRRWWTIIFLILLQIILFIIALVTYFHFHHNDYWIKHSEFFFLFLLALFTLFLCINLIENSQQRCIVLSPLNFHVSFYRNTHLIQQSSIDRAYICLQEILSYDILLYRLVFVIEDIDLIEITDYFTSDIFLRRIGKCLARNLYISYIESAHWNGIFPKYQRLKNYLQRQTVNRHMQIQ